MQGLARSTQHTSLEFWGTRTGFEELLTAARRGQAKTYDTRNEAAALELDRPEPCRYTRSWVSALSIALQTIAGVDKVRFRNAANGRGESRHPCTKNVSPQKICHFTICTWLRSTWLSNVFQLWSCLCATSSTRSSTERQSESGRKHTRIIFESSKHFSFRWFVMSCHKWGPLKLVHRLQGGLLRRTDRFSPKGVACAKLSSAAPVARAIAGTRTLQWILIGLLLPSCSPAFEPSWRHDPLECVAESTAAASAPAETAHSNRAQM